MTDYQWTQISFFSEAENWGDPRLMAYDLVSELDRYRHFVGEPMIITSGVQGKHHQLSLHHSGRATDFVFNARKRPLLDLFLDALRFNFSEVGLYPEWTYAGKECGGLHVGKSADTTVTRKKLWIGVDTTKGREYLPANIENFREFGLLKE